jgi:hypothetical protein
MFYNNNPYLLTQPGTYPAQQYMSAVQQMQPQQSQSQNNGIIWVQGQEGAKGYQLPPNSNVILMDSGGSYFYIKTTDASGMPQMRMFSFTEVTNQLPSSADTGVDVSQFVTHDELNKLKDDLGNYINSIFLKQKESSV